MSKKITKTYKVVIKHIYVAKASWESRGLWSFDFWLYENGKLKEWGNLDSTFTTNKHAMRSALKRGYAHQLVLQRYY